MAVDLESTLKQKALRQGQAGGARTLNYFRIWAALVFIGAYCVIIYGLGNEQLGHTWPYIITYLVVAFLIWLFARLFANFSLLSRFAIPLVDMPLLFLVLRANQQLSEQPTHVALFSLAMFLFLVALSSYTLRSSQVIASALVGTVGYLILTHEAGAGSISYVTGPVLIFLTAWVCGGIPVRAVSIISEAARQESHRNRLALYFSPGIADVIAEHSDLGESKKSDVTVLFCDIRGFTSMSESLDADEVVQFLNQFLALMVEEVFRHGGTLDKYLGDGLMAYFNAPVAQTDHATRAVQCALAMEAIISRSEENQLGNIEIGIGVHSGAAVVGNIGAPHRREFTVIGDTVNVASRIQALTKEHNCTVLVSGSTHSKIDPDTKELQLASVGQTSIRGRKGNVELYTPKLTSQPS